MKQWLLDNGLEMDSLGKKEVAQAVKTAPKELVEVLLLRQQLSKSSVKNIKAMQNAVCEDGRARGMFQFYGANRSGRWAGRMIQLQNLPQIICRIWNRHENWWSPAIMMQWNFYTMISRIHFHSLSALPLCQDRE